MTHSHTRCISRWNVTAWAFFVVVTFLAAGSLPATAASSVRYDSGLRVLLDRSTQHRGGGKAQRRLPVSGGTASYAPDGDTFRAQKQELTSLVEAVTQDSNIINVLLSYRSSSSKQAFSVTHGVADRETGNPMSEQHQIHIASMSKIFTAVLIAQLIEEGHFGFDTTLGDLFGNKKINEIFPNHQYRSRNGDRVPVGRLTIADIQRYGGRSRGDKITVSDLLRHTGGLSDVLFDAPAGRETLELNIIADSAGLPSEQPGIGGIQWSGESLLEYYLANDLPNQSLFAPGEGFHYGGTGYILAGLIIEKITGLSLSQVYRQRIFDPLSMNDTYLNGFEPARSANSIGLAHRFIDLTDLSGGRVGNIDIDADGWNTSVEWASGGLVSTASDLHAFYRALVNGQLFNNDSTLHGLFNHVEVDDGVGYGLGLYIEFDESGDPIAIEHSGYWGSFFIYVPESDISVVTTVNQVSVDSEHYFRNIRNAVLGEIGACSVDDTGLEHEIDRLKRQIRRKNRIIRQLRNQG